jgi:hypothetical protein
MTAPTDSDATRLPLLDLRFGAADAPRLRLSVEACAIQAGLGRVSKSPSVASGVQVVARKADEGGSLVWLSTEDNAASRRLGDAQQDSGTLRHGLGHLRLQRRGGVLRCQVRDAGLGFGAKAIPAPAPDRRPVEVR